MAHAPVPEAQGNDMSKITILHLSDLHISSKAISDKIIVLSSLIDDLRLLRDSENIHPDLIIFTGDLVNSGESIDQFSLAEKHLISPLLDLYQYDATKIIFVPGNHDIDREVVRGDPTIEEGLASIQDSDKLTAFIDRHLSRPKDHFYFSRLSEYHKFSEKYGPDRVLSNPFFTAHTIEIAGVSVGVATLNTAWRATGEPNDYDNGRLLMGRRAASLAASSLGDARVKIAAFHHPLRFLQEFDQLECQMVLTREFDVILTGHTHHQSPEVRLSPVGRAIHSEAGALYVSSKWFNGYAVITLNDVLTEAEFKLREWEGRGSKFRAAATTDNTDGTFKVNLNPPEKIRIYAETQEMASALRPLIEEMADSHLLSSHTETAAPKRLSDLYVDLPLHDQSQHRPSAPSDSKRAALTEISLDEVCQYSQPVIIYGARDTGKTTFGYNLCLQMASGNLGTQSVPIRLDFNRLAINSSEIRRQLRQQLGAISKTIDIDEHLRLGSFLFVIDNYNPNDTRKSGMFSNFTSAHPNNRFIFLADELVGMALQLRPQADPAFEHTKLFIHPLSRSRIRTLTEKWLTPTGLYNSVTVNAVISKITAANLPRTAYIVSMVAWTFERKRLSGPINEAALLEQIVDDLLNKSSIGEVSRNTLGFNVKVTFLSTLSKAMIDEDSYVWTRNRLLSFTLEFINVRLWKNDAAAFIEDLVESGVLWAIGNQVGFRFRCVREYFLAIHIASNDDFRKFVLDGENFIKFDREMDIFTGLQMDQAEVISTLMPRVQSYISEEFVSAEGSVAFESAKLIFGESDSIDNVDKLTNASITDENAEELLEQADLRRTPSRASSDLETVEGQRSVEDRSKGIAKAVWGLSVFSRIVRNSELIDDADLKRQATRVAVRGWGAIASWFVSSSDLILDAKLSGEAKKAFDEKFTEERKQKLEFTFKVILPVVITTVCHTALGTDKLRTPLEELIDDVSERFEDRLMASLLLIDLACKDEAGDLGFAIKKLEATLGRSSNLLHLSFVRFKLFWTYLTPSLGPNKRKLMENLLADMKARAQGEKGSEKGVKKGRHITHLRSQRTRIVGVPAK